MRRRPRLVKNLDVDKDPVMVDIRENFKEEDISEKTEESFLGKDTRRKIIIAVLILMAALYILARLRL